MKTLLIILVTLFVSQNIYQQYGSDNVLSHVTDACRGALHWVLASALQLAK